VDSINGISYYLNKCLTLSNTSQMTIFFRRQHTRALFVQHSPTAAVHLSEKYDFRVFPFCQVVHKHKLLEVAYQSTFWLPTLSVTFLPKNIKICSCVSKLLQTIGGTFFETRCMFLFWHLCTFSLCHFHHVAHFHWPLCVLDLCSLARSLALLVQVMTCLHICTLMQECCKNDNKGQW